MTFLHRLASILDWIFRRSRAEQHLDDEMRDFIERSAAEKVRDGVAVEDARRLARMELGGLEQAKERVRSSRHAASRSVDSMVRQKWHFVSSPATGTTIDKVKCVP